MLFPVLMWLFGKNQATTETEPSQNSTYTPSVSYPPETNLVLCEKDNGSTLRLKKGFHGLIELKGNATTGYSWRVQKIIGSSVKIGKWEYFPYSSPSMFVGGGGFFRLDFQVVSEGPSTILLVYDTPFYPKSVGYNYYLQIEGYT